MKTLLLMLFILAILVVSPISAQDADASPGPGLGGIGIDGSTAGDPATFNPLIGGDSASSVVYSWLYPAIIGLSPRTSLDEPNLDGAMAAGREYDESGAALTIGGLVLTESALSYIGVGLRAPTPSWGNMLNGGLDYMRRAPHLILIPGLLITTTVFCFFLIGDGLRDAFDPKFAE